MKFFAKNGISVVDYSLQKLKDKQGNVFFIPNYILNEPYYERQEIKPKDGKVTLVLVNFFENAKVKIDILSTLTVKDLMDEYVKITEITGNYKLRLFVNGFEMKAEEIIGSYKMNENQIVQVSIRKLN